MLSYSKFLELLSTLRLNSDLFSNLHSLANVSPFWESKCSILSKYHSNESIRSFSTLAFISCPHYLLSCHFLISLLQGHSFRNLVYHLLGGLLYYALLFSPNVLFSCSNFFLVISFFLSQFCLFFCLPLECCNIPHHWSYHLQFRLILPSFDLPKDLHPP